jgi:hypothetical protein
MRKKSDFHVLGDNRPMPASLPPWLGRREVVYMERPIEPTMRLSLADVLLCTFEKCRVFFISCEETSVLKAILVPLQHFLINETLHRVDITE